MWSPLNEKVKRALQSCIDDASADSGVRDEARAALSALVEAEMAARMQIAAVQDALRAALGPLERLRAGLAANEAKSRRGDN